MSKNVTVNGAEYKGVSQVHLTTTNGGTALFQDVDEITTPSGSISITKNGTYDVTNYASAEVAVETSGGGLTINGSAAYCGTFTVEADSSTTITVSHDLGTVPKEILIYRNDADFSAAMGDAFSGKYAMVAGAYVCGESNAFGTYNGAGKYGTNNIITPASNNFTISADNTNVIVAGTYYFVVIA